ncbi:TRAP transporter substrate-binding protein [Variovorax paradoxus]|uniref:TRAP transporter substrate-binding protein n=1 Tax=Variovorax paradoxus TaxID=34073 RepID=UPI00277DEA0F|nr:TRAP transporter substrate-binding protein [Variovorax paradoxus]MDQ0586222.1 tripartite ATP-independent transporter DctP family solute receptor [Variovorax paradoxus]
MKKTGLMLAAAWALLAAMSAARAEPVVLSLVHAAATTHPAHLAALQFARRVEERTHGQVRTEIFPASQLGSENELLQKVRLGAVDMDVTSLNYLIKYEKTFSVVVMPYLFDSYAHAHRVLDGPAMNWLAPLAEKQGFVILSNWEWGFRNLTNNKRPINVPEDVRGLRVRVPPVAELEATMEALGAQVSKVGFKELPQALSQGLVDGQENPLNVIYYNKLYEVQKHLALTRHVYYNTLHLMSTRTWAKLTPAEQAIVREESKVAGDGMRKKIIAEEEELIEKMMAAGVKVTRPDPAPFRAATQGAREGIRRFAGDENVRTFLKMVDAERRQ